MRPSADMLQQRLRVLHDPVGYLPAYASSAADLTGERRSALNAAVLRLHALPAYEAPGPEQVRWTQRLLRTWDALPAAAFLLACSAWGEARMAGLPGLRKLDPHAHLLLQLCLPITAATDTDMPTTRNGIAAWGGACMLASLPDLPQWLRARIVARFDPLPTVRRPADAQAGDLLCLSMALSHAQKNSGFSRSFRA